MKLEKILRSVGNHHRLGILSYVKKHGESSVGDIADHVKTSFKATSKHLSILSKIEILKSRYDGSFVMYRISEKLPEHADIIVSLL